MSLTRKLNTRKLYYGSENILDITYDEIEIFTKGCRNLKNLRIEYCFESDEDEDMDKLLQCLGSNNPLLETLQLNANPQ